MPKADKTLQSTGGKNVALTDGQKKRIIEEYDQCQRARQPHTHSNLAEWAHAEFCLMKSPNPTTIGWALKDRMQILAVEKEGKQAHRAGRMAECPELDEAFVAWVLDQVGQGVMVSGAVIQEQGRRLMAKMNEQLPDNRKLMLQFSEGWLSKFKTCHSLQSFKTHGESGSTDNSVLEMELPPLVEKISCYPPENVYNADETALFYNAAPDRTYACEHPEG